ncbi:MAG: helix-turn-helix transcriptional regulator [Candidatus Saccharicenans sp.]
MMTKDVQEAMLILYRYEQNLRDKNVYMLDKIDRALDQLSRNPNKTGDPEKMVRSALGNAATVLKNRKNKCFEEQHGPGEVFFSSLDEAGHISIEVRDFLNHPSLSKSDREILFYLMEDKDAREIAKTKGISVNLARVHISRVRARARKLWGAA